MNLLELQQKYVQRIQIQIKFRVGDIFPEYIWLDILFTNSCYIMGVGTSTDN